MAHLPTGTVTFLFTDIEGSTRLLQQFTDTHADVLMECRRLVRVAVQERDGQAVSTQGDAVFSAFPSAREALLAAIAAQQAILRHPWPAGAAMKVRMGLHTGEARIADSDYVGLDVHRSARICAAAHGGQILLSETTQALVAKALPQGVTLLDLGEHRLKDLTHPHRLFQVVAAGLQTEFPPLEALDVLPNNLPAQLTSFIGREREVAEVKEVLATARLMTLTGAGGSGKTRLALQVGAESLEQFSHGVWFVELAALADSALVPQSVASTLRVAEQPGRPLIETLTDYLRPRSLLLLLDNCEHLLTACAYLSDALLRGCPTLRILATSREGLGVAGETLYSVPTLPVPDLDRLPSTEDLAKCESVRLFIERATAVLPKFSITAANAKPVAQICYHLDGIPLAIELAAVRVKTLAVDQIVARLDDRFKLLTGESRTVLPRHQTLKAAMDWSYDLLSERERVVFCRLSVFAGGWTLDAAEGICSGDPIEKHEVLNHLAQLVEKSLVTADVERDDARYGMLETVRQYAWNRLQESGGAASVQRKHRDWYLQLVERVEPELRGQRGEPERLETEHSNLRAALEWCKKEDGVEAELRLAGALPWFWYQRGHWTEGRTRLEDALTRGDDAPCAPLAKVLRGAAWLAWRQGDYERAAVLGNRGLALCRQMDDKNGIAGFLQELGIVAIHRGNYLAANTLLEESLRLYRNLKDKWAISVALAQLGGVARYQGNYESAAAFYTESYCLSKEAGKKDLVAYALRNLGRMALDNRDYGRAIDHYGESLRLSRDIEDRWMIEECLEGLAGVTCALRRYEQAARLFGAAEMLREALGFHRTPFDQVEHDRQVSSTRAELGEAVFGTAWISGRGLPLEQTIEEALAIRVN